VSVRVLVGHVLDRLADLPNESVHCVVTSPPYYSLRSYGTEPQVWGGDPNCSHVWGEPIPAKPQTGGDGSASTLTTTTPLAAAARQNHSGKESAFCRCGAWRGDLGLEPTPWHFIEHLVLIFREIKRVLRKDATCWINIGDSYAGGRGGNYTKGTRNTSGQNITNVRNRPGWLSATNVKAKDLLMLPAQLALALRADGWRLRSEIVWAKKAPMPESCTDRPTCAHEKVFLLTKSKNYFYDSVAAAEAFAEEEYNGGHEIMHNMPGRKAGNRRAYSVEHRAGMSELQREKEQSSSYPNMRNVWFLGPAPFPGAHFAVFSPEIPRRAILAGTSAKGVCPKCGAPRVRVVEKKSFDRNTDRLYGGTLGHNPSGTVPGSNTRGCPDPETQTIGWRPSCACDAGKPVRATVLDCFLGSGTTALVADQLGRDCIGIELAPSYAAMSERRVRDDAGMFAEIAAE
jgi:DNA modification methylase